MGVGEILKIRLPIIGIMLLSWCLYGFCVDRKDGIEPKQDLKWPIWSFFMIFNLHFSLFSLLGWIQRPGFKFLVNQLFNKALESSQVQKSRAEKRPEMAAN